MIAAELKSLARSLGEPLAEAPAPLLAYALFVTLAIAMQHVFLKGDTAAGEWLRPIVGWSGAMHYMFSVGFMILIIYQRERRWWTRLVITMQLLLMIVFGAEDYYLGSPRFSGNPYLNVSPWRPVWTMVIPTFWILMLHLPSMSAFCRPGITPLDDDSIL